MKKTGLLFLAIIFYSCQPSGDTFEARKDAAKQLLSKDCDFVVNASTEFIKKKHKTLGEIMAAVIATKCDCITDSLAAQFANEYDLETIKNMQTQPIETAQTAIEKVLNKNSDAVKVCLTAN